ncbi:hypothetical protein CFN78_25220 [Amycolatopsis antarctica]|uniref:Uncharacterized protein n=1 Tax=Amycolatopsis antarctica TaxID=1854586 RepID=A0A263CZD4_9PSEU|nr:DUF6226 family protein [Amycolatopsis antarctica]OZM70465.1 hypothetical protein CFN78_25220 [Amycolatopsis antarctica]
MSRWGPEGPPEEAYSRVSDPAKFAAVHVPGRRVLAELTRRYQVRAEEYQAQARPAREGRHAAQAGPAVRLVPADPAAWPLTIVFTAATGIEVWAGEEHRLHLPVCACDACDETTEESEVHLRDWVGLIVAGTLGEQMAPGAPARAAWQVRPA